MYDIGGDDGERDTLLSGDQRESVSGLEEHLNI